MTDEQVETMLRQANAQLAKFDTWCAGPQGENMLKGAGEAQTKFEMGVTGFPLP